MRVLLLLQGYTLDDQVSHLTAFCNAKSRGFPVEVRAIPFRGYARDFGWDAFFRKVLEENEDFKPDLVFFQFFHGIKPTSPTPCIRDLHAAKNRPLVFGMQGDPFRCGWKKSFARGVPKTLYELAREGDAFFSTSMGALGADFVRHGAKNVIFLPHAYSNQHFPRMSIEKSAAKEYDVVMLGSSIRVMNPVNVIQPLHFLERYVPRNTAAYLLRKEFNDRFGLFGVNWPDKWHASKVNFKDQVELFQRSEIAVDTPPPLWDVYYASDRPFFIAGAGVPLVQFYTPRFEKLLADEVNAYYVTHLKDVSSVCRRVLNLPADIRKERARRTAELCQKRHLVENRVDTILSVAEAIADVRNGVVHASEAIEHLRLWHFLPEVDLNEERKYAILNWRPQA